MLFASFKLCAPILQTLAHEGYTTPTPVQAGAIPHVLSGRDVLACAQTGTGKTAAFALPMLHKLSASAKSKSPRGLILCPTRELATQIADSFRTYGRQLSIRTTTVFGGVSQHRQVQSLRQGTDVVIATPGRLLDLINQNLIDLRQIQSLVLDEADRMLDMGFINDIRKIVARLPQQRQTLLFSATMPPEIQRLAHSLLRNPATVQVAPVSSTADNIEQSVYHVERARKADLLAHLYHSLPMARTIVFTRTKHGADRVVRHLHARGIRSEAIHGNKSQNARERALGNFRNNKTPMLIATDIASRGIDIDDITHVVNYDLTHEPETYVHRIGRTARAGASGAAISLVDREEMVNLRAIECLLRRQIPVKRADHPASAPAPAEHHEPSRPAHAPHRQPAVGHPLHRAATQPGAHSTGASHHGPSAGRRPFAKFKPGRRGNRSKAGFRRR